jgi:serine/threonine protein kinase/Flp pilus assembly protein TadD
MSAPVSRSRSSSGIDAALAELVEDLSRRLHAGEAVDVEAVAAAHPEQAAELRRLLPALEAMAELSRSASGEAGGDSAVDVPEGGLLGDFRIVREVGRGGMGVVFEAVQVSLRRRVALKVLPLAGMLDPGRLQRFQNEAQAAACLHHTNIVPVYAVGREQGINFYAMQLIEGQTLAAVLTELRRNEQGKGAPAGRAAGPSAEATTAYPPPPGAAAAGSTAPQAALSTEGGIGNREYVRAVARLGVKAAEALDYAHQLGVVHRDIKPANLMVDGRGQLWVTDFGLAQFQREGEQNLTLTGNLVGTLRYMSPEQALAKRVVIDHRTDVYSLGATLYELLTLRPVFEGKDRQELLSQITFEEPRPLRRLNRAVPGELETIVLKALEKCPAERYATAQELADDLGRLLEDKPIQARRPSLWQHLRKRARRHRGPVAAAAVCLLVTLTTLTGSVGWVLSDRAGRKEMAEWQVAQALEVLQPGLQAGNPHAADVVRAARQVEDSLATGLVGPEMRGQAEALLADLAMLAKLEQIRLDQTAVKDERFDLASADLAYAGAFWDYGIDVEALTHEEAAERLKGRAIAAHLAAALDNWAEAWAMSGRPGWEPLLRLAQAVDPEPDRWRTAFREAFAVNKVQKVQEKLKELAAAMPASQLPPATLKFLGNRFIIAERAADTEGKRLAVSVLRAGQQHFPADFWLNHNLAQALSRLQPPEWDEAMGHYRVAVALRPESPGAHQNLGTALYFKGRLEEAITQFRKALRLKKDYADAHRSLGFTLYKKGRLEEAVPELREAIRLKKDFAEAHHDLGNTLHAQGRLEEAISEYQKVIRIKKDSINGHYDLGIALIAVGRLEEAIAECREAIRLKPDYPEAYCNLGHALREAGKVEAALAALRRGHELGSKRPGWPYPSAQWVRSCERLAALAARLPALLKGEALPASAGERLAFARFCQRPKKLYVAAARWYAEAFEAQPELADDLQHANRYNAACAAALAGCGQGEDAQALDEKERSRLRQQALDWLRADLSAWRAKLKQGTGQAGTVQQLMQHWLADPDFAGVRGPKALGRLPEGERRRWQRLWEQVEELRQQAAGQRGPKGPAGL